MKKYQKYLLFICIFFISHCAGQKGVIKKDYDFFKIKEILVIRFSSSAQYENSGDIFADMFAYKFLEKGYNVLSREFVGKETDFNTIREKAKDYNIDVIVTGSIFKYSIEKKIHALKKSDKEIKVASGSDVNVTIKEDEKELITSTGRMYGADVGLPYEIEATIGVIAKMIDVENGDIVWSARSESSGLSIEDAIESSIDSLFESMPEPFEE